MMTTDPETMLSEALQSLVDARLDTIDRMLLGRVDRQDRLAIVREVESQILEQLRGLDAGTLDRDDVLAVLARLDPPEAYLPGDDSPSAGPRTAFRPPARRVAPAKSRLAFAGGVLGIIAAVTCALCIPLGEFFGSRFIIFGSMAVGALASLLAIVFTSMAKLRGPWAITGLILGIVSMMVFLGIVGLVLSST